MDILEDIEWLRAEQVGDDSNFGSISGLDQLLPLLDESPESEGSTQAGTQGFTNLPRYSDLEKGDDDTYILQLEMADGASQAPNHPVDNFVSEMGHGGIHGLSNPVDSYESEMAMYLDNAAVAGPDQEAAPETSFAATSNLNSVMMPQVHTTEDLIMELQVPITEEWIMEVPQVPITEAMMIMEVNLLASKMMGKGFYEEMEMAGSSVLRELVSSLSSTLPGDVTVEKFKMEATKWLYLHMRRQNRKVAGHPKHIKEIPYSWRLKNPELFYPSDKDLDEIAKETGLQKRQVSNLFENDRKRKLKKIADLEGKLKSHFPPHITKILKDWQDKNHPRTQPAKEERKILTEKTGLEKKQIVDWYNNHRQGRNRSKKRSFESFEV
ncbi:unnamed protein product [Calypogeia fissa]